MRRYTAETQKQQQPEICIVIYDNSQGDVATRLRSDGTFYWCVSFEKIFLIGQYLAKLHVKKLIA